MRLTPSLCLAALVACSCSSSSSGGSSGGKSTGSSSGSGTSNGGSSGGSSGAALGAGCVDSGHCASGLSCVGELPGGYCSAACNPAACPAGGTCIEALPGQFACGLACAGDGDCTRGGYACDPTCLVCLPSVLVGFVSCPPNYVGAGGHLPDGGACGTLPAAGGQLSWDSSADVSASAATTDEFEGSGAASPGDAGLVVAAYMFAFDGDGGAAIGVSVSNDDGKSFAVGPQLAGTGGEDSVAQDPSVAVDPVGAFYVAWSGIYSGGATGEIQQGHVWVAASYDAEDGGTHGVGWTTPQNVLGPLDIPASGGGADKPVLGVNPSNFMPYVVMGIFSGSYGGPGPYGIKLITGEQGGFVWYPSVEVDDAAATQRAAWRDLPAMAFDAAGNAYLAWVEYDGSEGIAPIIEDQVTGTALAGCPGASIWFSEAPYQLGAPVPGPNAQVSHAIDDVVLDVPKIVAEPDGSKVYVAYTGSTGAANVTNILVATSADHGASWGLAVTVNAQLADSAACSTNFHPAAFLDGQDRLWVSWVSNVDGQGNVLYSVSTDQGASFSAPALLSDQPFSFNTQAGIPSTLGGYQALFGGGADGRLFSLWTGAPASGGLFPPSHVFLQSAGLP